jgi:hypothetical protein
VVEAGSGCKQSVDQNHGAGELQSTAKSGDIKAVAEGS